MKYLTIVIIPICVLMSCSSGSADKKVPELANEMCDCFTNFQKSISPDAVKLMKTVSVAANPQTELATGISKLSGEDAASFAEKLKSIGTKGSEVYACMEAFDKKHGKETTKDKTALTEKLLQEMQGDANCPIGAAIVNLSLSKNK
jgi:hypothetical protein